MITITDVNDRIPTFQTSNFVQLILPAYVGSYVETIVAVDSDSDPVTALVYSLEDSSKIFDINTESGMA